MTDLLKRLKETIIPEFEKAVSDNNVYFSNPTVRDEIGQYFSDLARYLKGNQCPGSNNDAEIEALKNQLSALQQKLDEKESMINELKITDNLTKLYNREHLVTVLEEEIARCHRYGHPLAVIMIDIDGLKAFNAEYGKTVGDRLLYFTGNLIKSNIRKFDRPFRYGGEEFMVVLPETDLTMAYIVAERIRKDFMSTCKREFSCSYTLSTGITSIFTYAANGVEIRELIDRADNALAAAKEKGGNISIKFE